MQCTPGSTILLLCFGYTILIFLTSIDQIMYSRYNLTLHVSTRWLLLLHVSFSIDALHVLIEWGITLVYRAVILCLWLSASCVLCVPVC